MIGRRTVPPEPQAPKPKGFDDFDLRLGDVMRGERATMGKSLLDVQRDLKIKATYIAGIENADPAAFETQGFIAGYVRSYARYLGLDPEWAYTRFCKEGEFVTAHGMSPDASANRPPKEPKSSRKPSDPLADPDAIFVPRAESVFSRIEPGAIGASLVLLMLISVIGYGGWSVFQAVQRVQLAPVDQAPGVTSEVGSINTNVGVIASLNENSGFKAPSIDALDRIYRPEALSVPVLVARDGPIAALDPTTVGTMASAEIDSELSFEPALPESELEVAPVQVVATGSPELILFAVRPSWVRVQANDGTVIFEKILDAGEQYILPNSEEPPVLRAGNAGSLYFTVDGQHYGPAGNGPNVVKNVVLSRDALSDNYQTADLSKDVDLARFVAVAQAEGLSPSD